MANKRSYVNHILKMVEKMDTWEIRWLVGHIMNIELPNSEKKDAPPEVDPRQEPIPFKQSYVGKIGHD